MKCLFRLCAVGMALVAAGSPAEATQWQGTVTDSAGVTIVANSERGAWAEGEEWTAVEELRIGSFDDPNYQFGEIASLAVGSDGAIYVLDAQAQRIQVYDAMGGHVRTMGGPGSGPGELGPGTAFIAMGAGDTLLVPDPTNARLNVYGASGESIGSVRMASGYGLIAWRGTRSGVVARQIRPAWQGTPDSMDVIEQLNMDGSVRDTVMRFAPGGTFQTSGAEAGMTILAAEPLWTIDDERAAYYGINDNYRISRYSGGKLTHIISKTFETREISESDQNMLREAIMDAAMDAAAQGGAPASALEPLRRMIRFRETYPAFAELAVGPRGTLWVQHLRDFANLTSTERANIRVDLRSLQRGGVDAFEDAGAQFWDVFDPDGRFLGVVTMPTRFAPLLFAGNDVYGVWRDDLDVQHVLRVRIER